MLRTPATANAGMSTASGASVSVATSGCRGCERDPDGAQRSHARAQPVGDSAGADARADGEDVDPGQQSGGGMRGHVPVLVQEEHDEAGDPDLRREVERRPAAEEPHARVTHRAGRCP